MSQYIEIPVIKIRLDSNNMRSKFEPIGEVFQNILNGVMETRTIPDPIWVREDGNGGFLCFAGFRRLKAAQIAELITIGCLNFGNISDERAKELSWIENDRDMPSTYMKLMHIRDMFPLSKYTVEMVIKELRRKGWTQQRAQRYAYITQLCPEVLLLAKTREELTNKDREIMKRYTKDVSRPFPKRSHLSLEWLLEIAKMDITDKEMQCSFAYYILNHKDWGFFYHCQSERQRIFYEKTITLTDAWEECLHPKMDAYIGTRLISFPTIAIPRDTYDELREIAIRKRKKLSEILKEISRNALKNFILDNI